MPKINRRAYKLVYSANRSVMNTTSPQKCFEDCLTLHRIVLRDTDLQAEKELKTFDECLKARKETDNISPSLPSSSNAKSTTQRVGTGNGNEEPIEVEMALTDSSDDAEILAISQICLNSPAMPTRSELPICSSRHGNEQSPLCYISNSLFNTPTRTKSIKDIKFSFASVAGFGEASATVSLGPNNTRISAHIYDSIDWTSPSLATKKLLMAIFDRNVLATHSMTGKPSPTFKYQNHPLKKILDTHKIADVIHTVTRNCNVSEKEVRNAIAAKCCGENKMFKLRKKKSSNKENEVG